MEPLCKHQHLHFENGGLHIVCANCGYAWVAVGKNPIRILQDVMARAMGLSELDRRSDPYAPPLVKKKEIVKKSVREAPKFTPMGTKSSGIGGYVKLETEPEPAPGPVVFLPASERRLIAEVGKKPRKTSKKSS